MDCGKGSGSLLLVLPVTVQNFDNEIWIEPQAANGLVQWLKNFSSMSVGLKLLAGAPIPGSVPISSLGLEGRLDVELFDTAWSPPEFIRGYRAQRKRLGALIDAHDYLQFAIGGAWGDWGAIGALEANRKGRKYSVWTDRVESEVMRLQSRKEAGVRRIVRRLNAELTKWLEERVIRQSTLGLFHGKDTFDAYQIFSRNPHIVHDIHIGTDDRIKPEELTAKVEAITTQTLEIIYVGRVHPDKGPLEWIEALKLVRDAGINFRARWFGAGPMEDQARALVRQLGLTERVEFPGNLQDRKKVLDALCAAHIMAFCHMTPESPRCLIEALVCGTPIVGYGSAYSADLISRHGGGRLTLMEPQSLASEIILLDGDRELLGKLIAAAAKDGEIFSDEAVFAHRSNLMKKFT